MSVKYDCQWVSADKSTNTVLSDQQQERTLDTVTNQKRMVHLWRFFRHKFTFFSRTSSCEADLFGPWGVRSHPTHPPPLPTRLYRQDRKLKRANTQEINRIKKARRARSSAEGASELRSAKVYSIPKMCATLHLVSDPLNPRPIVLNFRRTFSTPEPTFHRVSGLRSQTCAEEKSSEVKNVRWSDLLRSFPCLAVGSSSAHKGKVIIFERFQCSLTNNIYFKIKLTFGKINRKD